jgi:PKD repeat protein
MVDNVSSTNLNNYLTKLVNFGSRLYRAPGMFNASIWLHDVLNGTGRLEASYHNFTVVRPTWGTFVLSNVILTLPGLNTSSDHVYYMYAHSDAVQFTNSSQWLNNTPGADDDGSGCVAVLEAARILSQYKFQDTIKFAFFNAEEIGLVGSYEYAKHISNLGENVQGGIDYDMIGHSTGSTAFDLKMQYNSNSRDQGLQMQAVNTRYNVGLSINAIQSESYIPSDISSFYSYGFPSVFSIEQEFSPYYHSTDDVVSNINFTLINKCTKMAVGALAEEARLLYTDLTIRDGNLTISEPNPLVGDNLTLSANLLNMGNYYGAEMETRFYLDGNELDSNRLSVPGYGFNTTTLNWNATIGYHNLSIALDPENEVEETDENNNSAFLNFEVNDRPIAILDIDPLTGFTDELLMFNGSYSYDLHGGISEYNFSFGDGEASGWQESPLTSHKYTQNGKYNATLSVRDVFGVKSYPLNVTLTILNRPPVALPDSNLSRTYTFVPIQFYSNANDPDGVVTSKWDFDDGVTNSDVDPVHDFEKSGVYDVSLEVRDDDNASNNYQLRIVIDNRRPSCSINASAITGNITSKFTFSAFATDLDGTITGYSWDLGDGNTAKVDSITHSYSTPGNYMVRLTVQDDEGASAVTQQLIKVLDLPPAAKVTADPYNVLSYEIVSFDSTGSTDLEGMITYLWDFGDGNRSYEIMPKHFYTVPGSYVASLTVIDTAGQTNTLNLTAIQVANRGPVALFRFFGNLTTNQTLYFDGSASYDQEGDITYSWDFGDDSTDSEVYTDHMYKLPGTYTITLKVRDDNWLTNSTKQTITISAQPSTGKPGDNNKDPKITPKDPQGTNTSSDDSWKVSALLALNVFWIILLILLFSLIYLRRQRTKNHETASDDQPDVVETPQSLPTEPQPEPAAQAEPSVQPAAAIPAPQITPVPTQELPALPSATVTSTTTNTPPVAPLASPVTANAPSTITTADTEPIIPSQPQAQDQQ